MIDTLEKNIEIEIVLQHAGLFKEITKVEKLKSKEGVHVTRILFVDGTTIIAKHIAWDKITEANNSSLPPALQYETCNYAFLRMINGCDYIPKVFAIIPGLILLEDLGADDYQFTDEKTAQFAVTDALAKLHTTTRGKETGYNEYKLKFEIPKIETRKRKLSQPGLHFQAAKKWILALANYQNVDTTALKEEFLEAERIVTNSREFKVFLHNDYVSRRQSIVRNGKFYFLDFEHGQYGHALQEVVRLYLGKIEYNLKKGTYFRKGATLIDEAPSFYRKRWEYHSKSVPSPVWDLHFAAAAVYQALVVIGQWLVMPYALQPLRVHIKPENTLTGEMENIGNTLGQLLKQNTCFSHAARAVQQLSKWIDPQANYTITLK